MLYDCRNHEAVHTTLESSVTESTPEFQKFWKWGLRRHQQLLCSHSIPANLSLEHQENMRRTLDEMIGINVPIRTRHKQCLAPWISSHTSNLLKHLKTKKVLLERKSTSYRKQQIQKLGNLVADSSEQDREEYEGKLLSTRTIDAIFEHLNCLNKSPSLLKIMISFNNSSTVSMKKLTCWLNFSNQFSSQTEVQQMF